MTEASCDRVMEEIRRKRIAEPELVGRMMEAVTVRKNKTEKIQGFRYWKRDWM